MVPSTLDALLIIGLVIAPGYLFLMILRLALYGLRLIACVEAQPSPPTPLPTVGEGSQGPSRTVHPKVVLLDQTAPVRTTDPLQVLLVISLGVLLQSVAFPLVALPVIGYYRSGVDALTSHAGEIAIRVFIATFAWPVVLGAVLWCLVTRKSVNGWLSKIGLGKIHRRQNAWAYATDVTDGSWIRVHLKDGKNVVAGCYSTNSFSATAHDRTDIYIEQGWPLDATGRFPDPRPDSKGVWIAHDTIARVYFFNSEEDLCGPQSSEH